MKVLFAYSHFWLAILALRTEWVRVVEGQQKAFRLLLIACGILELVFFTKPLRYCKP
jgi:hypothetical protein